MRGAGGGENVFAGAGAGIDKPACAQVIKSGAVEVLARALRVGSERAAAIRAFLPLKTKPLEVFEHGLNKFIAAARGIEVLAAQHQGAGMGARPLLGNPEGSRVAKMEQPGGRRRQTAPIGSWGWQRSGRVCGEGGGGVGHSKSSRLKCQPGPLNQLKQRADPGSRLVCAFREPSHPGNPRATAVFRVMI